MRTMKVAYDYKDRIFNRPVATELQGKTIEEVLKFYIREQDSNKGLTKDEFSFLIHSGNLDYSKSNLTSLEMHGFVNPTTRYFASLNSRERSLACRQGRLKSTALQLINKYEYIWK